MKDLKYELISNIAQKFVSLSELDKAFIAGYMAGKQEYLSSKEMKNQEEKETEKVKPQ